MLNDPFQYASKEFGTCPLIQCSGQPVLPVGLKDEMGAETCKIFCPKCSMVYHPPPVRSRAGNASGVDGAAFGTTFPHLFLMTFANLVPDPLSANSTYIPRVFGFRLHKVESKAEPAKVESDDDKRARAARKRKTEKKPDGSNIAPPSFLVDSSVKRRKRNGGGT